MQAECLQLENYDFFIRGLSTIIERLQAMAIETFKREQSLSGNVPVETAVGRANYLPTNFLPRTVVLDTSRSLCTIVNKEDIFHILHRQAIGRRKTFFLNSERQFSCSQMLFLLREQTLLLNDRILEGVPTQDLLVSMEREPESLEESELLTTLASSNARVYIRSLQQLAARLRAIDERVLVSLVWTIILGDQVSSGGSGAGGGWQIDAVAGCGEVELGGRPKNVSSFMRTFAADRLRANALERGQLQQ